MIAGTAGGLGLFFKLMGRAPDLTRTEDELILGLCIVPIVLAGAGLWRVGAWLRSRTPRA